MRWLLVERLGRRKVVAVGGHVNRSTQVFASKHARTLRFRTMVSTVTISGMVAVHSKRAVFTALSGVPGVVSAEVELGRAVIEHDVTTTPDALIEAIALAGCEVTSLKTERRLPLSG